VRRAAACVAAYLASISAIAVGPSTAAEWTFDIGGIERHAIYDVPPAGKGAHPLVIALHGIGGTGADSRRGSWTPPGEREGFITVYPDGIDKRWDYGRQLNRPMPLVDGQKVDDIVFFTALIERAVSELDVDRKRVYLAGYSNGGLMAHRIACAMDQQFAAVASYISGMTNWQAQGCRRECPVPIMLIAGTDDIFQSYAGTSGNANGYLLSVPNTIAIWRGRNGCKTYYEENLPDIEKLDGTTVTLGRYDNCTDNAEVLFYRVNGGGHRTPTEIVNTSPPRAPYGRTNHDIDTAEVSWDFFKRFQLP
jgi:polyhydroxybutyrate depolymerase